MLKRCRDCGGTVAITRTTDINNCTRWIIIGHGMQPWLIARWNRERGMPDDGEH